MEESIWPFVSKLRRGVVSLVRVRKQAGKGGGGALLNGDDGVGEAGGGVRPHLPAVPGVVQEAGAPGLGDEPVYGGEDVVAGGVEGPAGVGAVVVAEDDLGAAVGGVAAVGEELGDVGDVYVAAGEGVRGLGVVYADEEGFLASLGHGWGMVRGLVDPLLLQKFNAASKIWFDLDSSG